MALTTIQIQSLINSSPNSTKPALQAIFDALTTNQYTPVPLQGLQGIQGVKGDRGDIGLTGLQGIQGDSININEYYLYDETNNIIKTFNTDVDAYNYIKNDLDINLSFFSFNRNFITKYSLNLGKLFLSKIQ